MDRQKTYSITEITKIYRNAVSEQEDLLCRLLLSIYAYCSPNPSKRIISSTGLQPDNLDSILDKEALLYLTENYASVVATIIGELSHSSFASNNYISEGNAIDAAIKNLYSKWEGVFVFGAGINHFLQRCPDNPVFGLELNPQLWGIGQIYLESQGWDNVVIFQNPSDIPWDRTFHSILLLSPHTDYLPYIKKGIGNSYELLAVLPREICFSESYLNIRRSFLKSGHLKSITVVHTGDKGLAIVYCLNSHKKKLRFTSSFSKRLSLYAFYLLFPKMPAKSLLLLVALLGMDFFLSSFLLLLYAVFPFFSFIPEPVVYLMWGISGLLFMVFWIACRVSAQEAYNPQIQFAAVLDFRGASLSDWEVLMSRTLRTQKATEKRSAIQYHSTEVDKDIKTVFSRYFVAQKSLSEGDLRAFVFVKEDKTQPLSNLVSAVTPSRITDNKDIPVLHIIAGDPLTSNYLQCEIGEELLNSYEERRRSVQAYHSILPEEVRGNHNSLNFSGIPRYFIPSDTYLWYYSAYSSARMKVGHVSREFALLRSFAMAHTLLFSIISEEVEKDFLLKELLTEYVQEQLFWLIPNPSQEDLLSIRVRVPSIEQQNRELRAEAFVYLEKEHNRFVSMVTNHKHEVGNLLKFLYYDFDTLKFLIEQKGHVSLDDVVDPRKGSTVRDYFYSIDGYKAAIGQEMLYFWTDGYGEKENFNLKDSVESFVRAKSTSPYSIEVDIPKNIEVSFSQKGLFTILRNIFINAEKHAFTDKARKNYLIKLWHEDIETDGQQYARLYVANNGAPLPEGITVSNIFEQGIGTGSSEHIGCHTIKEICENFGGYVSIEENTGKQGFTLSYIINLPKAS